MIPITPCGSRSEPTSFLLLSGEAAVRHRLLLQKIVLNSAGSARPSKHNQHFR
jgi:hypothetical protein